ncbi:hypothetical protein BU17DRAFT_89488 [Hysterangium stoloniferum]|nr:hypothetical protein BU17DRAFT_89488 [Hysterangium stoloniferum]
MAKYVPPHLRENISNKSSRYSTHNIDAVAEHMPLQYTPKRPPIHSINFSPCFSDHNPIVKHFLTVSPIYVEWRNAKQTYASSSEVIRNFEAHRETQRNQREANNDSDTFLFRNQFMRTFRDICDFIKPSLYEGVNRFMDLGCAPGGFSKSILEFCRDARGLGVTLPFDEHGLSMPMGDWTEDEKKRYILWEHDLLHLPDDFHARVGEFFSGNLCDLVICGAVYRDSTTLQSRRNAIMDDPIDAACRPALEFSQLLIAFRHLKTGGTLISVASLRISLNTLETLLFLRNYFTSVTPVKSSNLHCTRSTYYLVCQGFRPGATERTDAAKCIEAALAGTEWGHKRVSLTEGVGLGSGLQLLENETEYLRNHFEPRWEQQTDAMKFHLETLKGKRPTFYLGNHNTIARRLRSNDWRTTLEM